MPSYSRFIPHDIAKKYDFFNYNHAVEILANSFPAEWEELLCRFTEFTYHKRRLIMAGGANPAIPPEADAVLDRWAGRKSKLPVTS